jgi:peroxiredoxin
MSVSIGQTAPDFKLFNTERQEVSLSDYKGKNLIIHFFPLAFTGVCTAQLCQARDNMDVYTKLNAEVVGISVDSLFSLGVFAKENNYNFPLLSDFNKDAIKAYDVVIEEFAFGMHGVSKRAAFVIDKEGIVRYAEVTPTPGDLPNFAAIKETLESLV